MRSIPQSKLTEYLLKPHPWDDKSKFLSKTGFARDRPEELEAAFGVRVVQNDAMSDGQNAYGQFHRVEGSLTGPNNRSLEVVLVWLEWNRDGSYHFVTLKPARRRQ